MRVLHVETGRHLYGGALQVLYLLQGLRERGVESTLLAPRGSEVASRAEALGLSVHPIPYRGEMDVAGALSLTGAVRGARADILHLHSRRGADTWGVLAGAVSRTTAVLTRRVDNPELPWLARLKYGHVAHVIAISETIESVLLRSGVERARVSRVYSAVAVDEWARPRNRAALEAEFDVPGGVAAGAMVAQFIERKGHDVLIEALRRLRADGGGVPVVVLFGRGPLRDRVEEAADAAGVAAHLRFAGFRDDLSQWLASFDFCVHPAVMEGLGVAVLQAGAAGLPVIGARAGGVPEVVIDGETGYLTSAGDAGATAAAMRRLMGDRDQARVLGMRARQRIQDRFSVGAMVDGNLAVYRKVLEESGR